MRIPGFLGPIVSIGFSPQGGFSSTLAGAGKELAPNLAISGQERDYWCWAAVTEGIWRFYETAYESQCQIATGVLPNVPQGGCCGTEVTGPCNRPYYLERSLAYAKCLDARVDNPIGFPGIVQEINLDHPVGIRIQWPDGSGHFVTVSGWRRTPAGDEIVTVQDPWGPTVNTMPESKLRQSYGTNSGRWTHSYLTASGLAPGGAIPEYGEQPGLLGGG